MATDALKAAIRNLDGDFELVRELGRGATAIVYLLRDHQLERDVALKVIRGGVGVDAEAIARLEREAHLVAQLQHPNIVKLYGTQRLPDESVALLMEHVPGRNLKEILRKKGGLPIPSVLSILQDVASALAYAHRRRIVHRDVKPENIYIDEEVGAARLADFGVARPWDQDSRLTLPGASLGTPAYMSPEQIDGREVDGRSDVYSLGLVGYEMILGYHPWEDQNVFTTISKQKSETLPMDLPGLEAYPMLARLLEGALEKDPDRRLESAAVFLAGLREVASLPREDASGGASGAPRAIDWPDFENVPRGPGVLEEPGARTGPGRPGGPRATDDPEPAPEEDFDERDADTDTVGAGAAGTPATDTQPSGDDAADTREPDGLAADFPAPEGHVPETSAQEADATETPAPDNDAADTRAPDGQVPGTPAAGVPAPEAHATGAHAADVHAAGTHGAGTGANDTRTPSRTRRKGPRIWVWAVAAVILLGGIYGISRQYLAEEEPGSLPEAGTVPRGSGPTAPPPSEPMAEGGGIPTGATLLPLGETEMEGQVGSSVMLTVRVTDSDGNPAAGTPVIFRILEGEGRLTGERVETGAGGLAEAELWLPREPDTVSVGASLAGSSGLALRFAVRAVPGRPREARIIVGDTQTASPGQVLPTFLGVRVRDELGNFVSGAPVRFQVRSGGGRVQPDSTVTDDVGRAFARWTLGPPAGVQTVAALVPGSRDSVLVFRATAIQEEPREPEAEADPVPETEEPAEDPAPPAPPRIHPSPLAIGGSHVCRLRDGNPSCHGASDRGQIGQGDVPATLVALASGVSHTCALDENGEAWCWGANESGQLGDTSTQDRSEPVPVATDVPFAMLAAGLSHTCGLDGRGVVHCWGRNLNGQLGDGTRSDRHRPVTVPGTERFESIVAGWNHTCGLTGSGRAYCWGSNEDGQLGDGARLDRLSPVRVAGTFRSLAAGAQHTCGIDDRGEVVCWGENRFGQLGNGQLAETRVEPTPTSDLPGPAEALAAGAVHTCALLGDGSVLCWGQNLHGQLGNGTTETSANPVPVAGDLSFSGLFAGGGVTCALGTDGSEYCWGLNQGGQLGDGTRTNRSVPVRVGR